ncbi:MAG: right-handed parallel beta-helix repeat-containing protein [Candidatus Hydrogenedentes bacterium]|nr:right-handed parallel beta-helix repeat-containing protein [Candidatus Hydrogenedentota bacterium]
MRQQMGSLSVRAMFVFFALFMVFITGSTEALDLHVKNGGNDAEPGTLEAPLATLAGARDCIRRMRAEGSPSMDEPIAVHIHAGEYEMPDGLDLEAQDSGDTNAPVTYAAATSESPVLLGGRRLPWDAFHTVSDAAILDRLPPESHGGVRCAELKPLGMADYGEMPDAYRTPPAVPELFFNGARMTLARWPNGDEWAIVGDVVDSGPAPWRNFQSPGTGTFVFENDRPLRWRNAPAVWLYGYWCFDWASETIRVKTIDPEKKTITLRQPHVYGIGSGNPGGRRYCALNLLEELDAPGEYFLDRDTGQLYFWPPEPAAEIVLSLAAEPLLRLNGASHVTLKGIEIACTAGDGIRVAGGEQVHVESCNVRNTGLAGIVVQGGRSHRVTACDITETGTGGLMMNGGDRKTLTPSGHEACDNRIWRVARRQRTHAYNVQLGGVAIRLAHNLIHDAPHQAIGIGGNDHVIEFNEIHHICMESDDCGAFYMGRNPSERGTILRYNYWHDTGGPRSHGSCAVYFDDGSGGQMVFGNVFQRAAGGSFGAVFVHGGHDNRVINNVFLDCTRAIRQVPWNDGLWREWVHGDLWRQRLLDEVDITQPPYVDRYPELKGFLDFNGEPRVNYAERNVVVRCPAFLEGSWTESNNWITDSDPGFADMEANDFRFKPDAVVFQQIPGFEDIPFGAIGPRRPVDGKL